MLSNKTIRRIVSAQGERVVIGRYTYICNVWTGDIMRCLSEDIGQRWIAWSGDIVDAWEVVAHA